MREKVKSVIENVVVSTHVHKLFLWEKRHGQDEHSRDFQKARILGLAGWGKSKRL